MPTKIKCELMEIWDFDHCLECKRFISRIGKGLRNWECKLNRDNANERREFAMIWATAYLNDRGMDIGSVSEVEIEFVGKKKRKKAEINK